MINAKKVVASLMVGSMFAFAAPAVFSADGAGLAVSTVYAAKGGAKFSAPKPAPKAAPKASAPSSKASESKSVSGNGKDYKPSKDAKSLEKDAPGTNAKSSTAAPAAQQSSSRFGSIMRNVGLLAGGMFLGSMLANLFGMGGFFGDMLGLLMNIVMFGAVFMLIRWGWNRLRGNKAHSHNGGWQSRSSEPVDVTPRDSQGRPVYQDISRLGNREYDAKSMADRYRNRYHFLWCKENEPKGKHAGGMFTRACS